MTTLVHVALASLLLAGSSSARSEADIMALSGVFERPEGERICAAQKERLRQFLDARKDVELGRIAYAHALMLYFDRDLPRALQARRTEVVLRTRSSGMKRRR